LSFSLPLIWKTFEEIIRRGRNRSIKALLMMDDDDDDHHHHHHDDVTDSSLSVGYSLDFPYTSNDTNDLNVTLVLVMLKQLQNISLRRH